MQRFGTHINLSENIFFFSEVQRDMGHPAMDYQALRYLPRRGPISCKSYVTHK